ncbi:MAG: Wzy polymerase domain-containing protein, partial [Gammaproteobacteria bacterium]|nr:Wzy polymerase domain-containing protein [Gammaproteobacteria bacterium]
SGILAAIIAVVSGLIRCGPRRAAGYIAMLLPITLHTQVELPFYISSAHWFLWLFLIFVVMRHRVFKQNIRISLATTRLIQAGSLIVVIGSLYFLQHTSRAQADIMDFVTQRAIDSRYLEVALENPYHKKLAEELAMRALLNTGIRTNNPKYIRQYIQWSVKPITMQPKLIFFEDLIRAYNHLNDHESRCRAIKSGLKMYAQNRGLRDLNQSCNN